MTNKIVKVVLCGPPHSGKSCMRYGLKEAIKTIENAHYPYVITACPDGEGSWFQETGSQNPDLAATLKASNKGNFTKEQINVWSDSIKNCIEPLTLVDIGGIPDAKNEQICAHATHAILLAGHCDHFSEWRTFCEKLNLQVIAELYSDYKGTEDKNLILGNDNIYRGSIHYLERGDLSVQQRPTVIELAHLLVSMVTTTEQSYGNL
jgi:CRISPR-associated protein Csx3